MAKPTPVGALRASQLLHTFGVGAIVDLPHISAMVLGLEDWNAAASKPIVEDRLLRAVRRQLGQQVERMLAPPVPEEQVGLFLPAFEGTVPPGVPVIPFPSYMRCPACETLAPRVPGIFDLKVDPRPERTRYVHSNCQRAVTTPPAVLPARFIVACERGHLDEFPWVSFVHRGDMSCKGSLVLRDLGVSGEAAHVEVRCRACDSARRMADAFGDEGLEGYTCRGRRPHLKDRAEDGCTERPKTILLGASNSWFEVALSALYVPPPAADKLAALVEEHWADLKDATELAIVGYLKKKGELPLFAGYTDQQIFAVIEARTKGTQEQDSDGDLKAPEWKVLTAPASAPKLADFRLVEVDPPADFADSITRVVLLERLRAVTALTGFTRIASPADYDDAFEEDSTHRMPLSRKPPVFVPATEVRGEGIFIQFDEDRVAEWCAESVEREDRFLKAHMRWRQARGLLPLNARFPGIRFVLLHAFAHALMRQLSLECGYASASLKERIYSRAPEDGAMAGVVIYTAAPDSEGTLGGLVSLGTPASLGRHIKQALRSMELCASDPLCADHTPGEDGSTKLHGAACHACLFAPETSCEAGNRFLDRTTLVATVAALGGDFFGEPSP